MTDPIQPAADTVDERPAAPGVPTQVANPRRTTIRTIVQYLIGTLVVLVPLVNAVLVSVADYIATQTDVVLPAWVSPTINAGIVGTAFIVGIVARIMSTPGVQAFIVRHLPWLAPIKPI